MDDEAEDGFNNLNNIEDNYYTFLNIAANVRFTQSLSIQFHLHYHFFRLHIYTGHNLNQFIIFLFRL